LQGCSVRTFAGKTERPFLFFLKTCQELFIIFKLTIFRYYPQVVYYIFYMNKKRGTKKGTKIIGSNRFSFGRKLATMRRKKGFTQVELAKMLNTTARVISYYERESMNPSLEMVKKIAEALKAKPETLLAMPDENNNSNEIEFIDRSLSKKFELAQKLPNDARTQLKKFIDTLTKANNFEE